MTPLTIAESAPPPQPVERRSAARSHTILRLVRVAGDSDEGLARCRNISNTGMLLETGLALAPGDPIHIAFSPNVEIRGTVAWTEARNCGVAFDLPVDSLALLASSAAESHAIGAEPVRLRAALEAEVTVEGRLPTLATVIALSQRDLTIVGDGDFPPEFAVRVALPRGLERRGLVRATDGHITEIQLTEPFTVEELGSVRAL